MVLVRATITRGVEMIEKKGRRRGRRTQPGNCSQRTVTGGSHVLGSVGMRVVHNIPVDFSIPILFHIDTRYAPLVALPPINIAAHPAPPPPRSRENIPFPVVSV